MTGDALDAVVERLASSSPLAGAVARGASFAGLCTYRVGGPVAALVDIGDVAALEAVRIAIDGADVATLVVGRGSNLLVADEGFPGVVLRLGPEFETIAIDADQSRVVAGGAALLPVVARKTAAAGLTGFEWAVGVPGSIGGAVRMNAGGHGSDMSASLRSISLFDLHRGGPEQVDAGALELGYRRSAIRPTQIVLFAELQLAPGDRDDAEAELSSIVRWRRAHQPGGQNAGSVFANPSGDSAGRLIDAAGLKGFRIGSAEVSTKHANFIQADPDGSANDVHRLIRHVQRQIKDTYGIDLEPENLLVGFHDHHDRGPTDRSATRHDSTDQ